jgi:hypothetical protein
VSKVAYINHVVLVLDKSASMSRHKEELIQVADGQIEYLARRSTELDQETRVSVYAFDDRVECLVFDRDVLRLPSIRSLYHIGGNTALIDATIKSLRDLADTSTLYGDHAFLIFVLTDGQENRSYQQPSQLRTRLEHLPSNWTVGVLVPNAMGVHEAKSFGFTPDNISVWDTTSAAGVREVGETIKRATESFMQDRSRGVRTRSLFSTGVDAVNPATVAGLRELSPTSFHTLTVRRAGPIRDFVENPPNELTYISGRAFYQLTKTETIQPQKNIAIREKATGKVFLDQRARDILGLPQGVEVRVKPEDNPLYDVFVQSTSVNRKLVPNTDVLVLR